MMFMIIVYDVMMFMKNVYDVYVRVHLHISHHVHLYVGHHVSTGLTGVGARDTC